MPSQVVYQTNADLIASHEAMAKNKTLIQADLTQKGLLWFRFKKSQTIFQLSPQGKLQVKWNDVNEKKILYKLIKNLLVAKQNQKLFIKPLKQQVWIEYQAPTSFKLYWCNKATEYSLKEPSSRKPKKAINKQLKGKQDNSKWTSYQQDATTIRNALEELRHEFRFFREPTLNEIKQKAGDHIDSTTIEDQLALAGWKPPQTDEIEYIRSTAEKAINLAGLLKLKKTNSIDPKWVALAKDASECAQPSVIQTAQNILKYYPEIVPKITKNKLRWPPETISKWIEVFGQDPSSQKCWEQP